MELLLVANTHIIRVIGLQNSETLAYINSATVTAQIKNLGDEDIGSEISLNHVTDSDGDYDGVIPATVPIEAGNYYVVEVRAEAPTGEVAFWRFERVAEYRQP